jgi:hypothetical protein
MTEIQIRRAMNIVVAAAETAGVEDAGARLTLNRLQMPDGRRMALFGGAQLALNDVVSIDIASAHVTPAENLAIVVTANGDQYAIPLDQIYSLGFINA